MELGIYHMNVHVRLFMICYDSIYCVNAFLHIFMYLIRVPGCISRSFYEHFTIWQLIIGFFVKMSQLVTGIMQMQKNAFCLLSISHAICKNNIKNISIVKYSRMTKHIVNN